MTEFHETTGGRAFYGSHVPRAVVALERIATALERIDERAKADRDRLLNDQNGWTLDAMEEDASYTATEFGHELDRWHKSEDGQTRTAKCCRRLTEHEFCDVEVTVTIDGTTWGTPTTKPTKCRGGEAVPAAARKVSC